MSPLGQTLLVRVPGREPEAVRIQGDGPFPLGRSPDKNKIVVNDVAVSRQHAEISIVDGGYWIEDLKSKNGTKVNGTLIKERVPLGVGDLIEIGPCKILFGRKEDSGSSARIADTKAPGTVHAVPLADIVNSPKPITGKLQEATAAGAPPPRLVQFLQSMDRFGPGFQAQQSLPELYGLVVDLTAEVLRSDRTVVIIRGPDGEELIPTAVKQQGASPGEPVLVSRSIARRAIDDRTAILSGDAQQDERFRGQQSVIRQRIHSAMCVPLWHEEEVLGVIYVDNVAAPAPFDETDLRILTLIGHMAGAKILATQAAEELEQARLREQELQRAASIQQSLLPPEPLHRPPVHVAGKNVPSLEVGGDYFDFIEGEGSQLTVGLGDVAGKGLPAALLMTSLHAGVRAHVESEPQLPVVMARLNRAINHDVRGERFITLVLISLDCETGEFRYVNAGHNPPYLVRASGEVEMLSIGGLLLGMFPEAGYESATLALNHGDILVLYSDGVTDARDDKDDEFGEERLAQFLKQHRKEKPEHIVDALIQTVFDYSKDRKPGDDVTVTVIRRD